MADADSPSAESLLETPLATLHRALGARMVPFAGYAMPVQYPSGILAEHNWTREKAGLFDVSHMGQAFLEGPDHATTARALEALTPGDFLGLAPGRIRYTLLTTAEGGGIIDDLMVTRPADAADGTLFLVVNAARKAIDYAHIAANLPEGVTLRPIEDRALLALQGPLAAAVLARHVPGAETMGFMTAADTAFDGIPVAISRSGYTGEDGYEISVAATEAEAVARALLAAEEVKPIGLGARDSLRLEAGLCLYGHDIDEATSPAEADLGFAVSKRRRAEGGFPGAGRIIAEFADGPARLRVGIQPEGRGGGRLRADRRRTGRDGLCRRGCRRARHAADAFRTRQGSCCARGAAALRAAPLFPQERFLKHAFQPTRTRGPAAMATYFTKDHEWVRIDGDIATVGITDYAQSQLGDVVYVELPEIGKELKKGDEAAVVESVKAASEVFAPISGTVEGVNSGLVDQPAAINEAAEGAGWFLRLVVADKGELSGLMDESTYRNFLETL